MDLGAIQFRDFVGRKRESTRLKKAIDELKDANGSIVFVKGEVGVGKTRLVNHVIDGLDAKDYQVLKGKCMFMERADPFLPIYQLLKNYCDHSVDPVADIKDRICTVLPSQFTPRPADEEGGTERGANGRANLLPLGLIPMSGSDAEEATPEEREAFGPLIGLSSIDSESVPDERDRDQLFETIFTILSSISENKPTVLFIDDFNWADNGTISFVQYLSSRISTQRFTLILTYQPDDYGQSEKSTMLSDTVSNLAREDSVSQIELSRLTKEEVEQILLSSFDLEEIPEKFLDRIYDRTEGNPFFIQEIIRGLVNDGVIDSTGYTWLNKVDLSKVSIPSSLEDMVTRRMGKLSPEALKVLKYASIVGLQFNFSYLLALVARPEEEVLDALDELIEQKLIYEEPGTDEESYRFDNAIVRDLAYASLSKSRKRLIHKKIGEIIETKHSDDVTPVIFDLAYHFNKGKEYRKGLYYLIKAGEGASAMYAYHEALDYFIDAFECLRHLESSEGNTQIKEGLLFNIGYCKEILGEWDDALEYYNRALQLTTLSKHMKLHGQIMRHTGDIHRKRGDYGLANLSYKNAISAARFAKDYHTLAESYRGTGYVSWRRGKFSKATKEYESSIKYARRIKDHSVIAVIFIEVGNLYSSKGQFNKALDHYQRALDILEKTGNLGDIARSYNNIGDVYLQQEDFEKAVEYFRQSERYARKVGNINMAYWALFNTADAYAHLGELDKAMDLCKTAEGGLKDQNDKVGLGYTYMVYGIIHSKKGDQAKSKDYFDKSTNIMKEVDVPLVLAEVYYERGKTQLESENVSEGKKTLEESLELFESLNARYQSNKIRMILDEL